MKEIRLTYKQAKVMAYSCPKGDWAHPLNHVWFSCGRAFCSDDRLMVMTRVDSRADIIHSVPAVVLQGLVNEIDTKVTVESMREALAIKLVQNGDKFIAMIVMGESVLWTSPYETMHFKHIPNFISVAVSVNTEAKLAVGANIDIGVMLRICEIMYVVGNSDMLPLELIPNGSNDRIYASVKHNNEKFEFIFAPN